MSPASKHYPVLVTKEADTDWNVVFPDLPGCVTAGRSVDEALAFAEEALALHVQGMREDGKALPTPSNLEALMADPESAGALFHLVPIKPLKGRMSRVEVALDEFLLAEIDATAKEIGSDRSKFLAAAARHALDSPSAVIRR